MSYNPVTKKFEWCVDSVSSYRKWCPNEPNLSEVTSGKRCVAMKVNRSDDKNIGRGCLKVFDCSANLPYLCHRRCSNYEAMSNLVNIVGEILQL